MKNILTVTTLVVALGIAGCAVLCSVPGVPSIAPCPTPTRTPPPVVLPVQ